MTDPRLGPYFQQLERQYGLPGGFLARTRYIESGNGRNLYSPTGPVGDFQFTRGTAKAMGLPLEKRLDPFASAEAAAKYAAQNKTILGRALGRDPTGAELYMGHQQGGGGAAALLSNPNAAAGKLTDPNNIRVNAGDPSAPARSILAKFEQKYNTAKPDVPAPPLPPATEIATRPIVAPGALPAGGETTVPPVAATAAPARNPNATILELLTKDGGASMGDVKSFLASDRMKEGMAGLGKALGGEAKTAQYAPTQQLQMDTGGGDPTLLAAAIAKQKALAQRLAEQEMQAGRPGSARALSDAYLRMNGVVQSR